MSWGVSLVGKPKAVADEIRKPQHYVPPVVQDMIVGLMDQMSAAEAVFAETTGHIEPSGTPPYGSVSVTVKIVREARENDIVGKGQAKTP